MTTKKQLRNRDRLARQLLIAEMRLAQHYGDGTPDVYQERVLSALTRTYAYVTHFPDADVRLKCLSMFLHGDDVTAICNELNISKSTYYNWHRQLLGVFGGYVGVRV